MCDLEDRISLKDVDRIGRVINEVHKLLALKL